MILPSGLTRRNARDLRLRTALQLIGHNLVDVADIRHVVDELILIEVGNARGGYNCFAEDAAGVGVQARDRRTGVMAGVIDGITVLDR